MVVVVVGGGGGGGAGALIVLMYFLEGRLKYIDMFITNNLKKKLYKTKINLQVLTISYNTYLHVFNKQRICLWMRSNNIRHRQ